MSIVSSPVEDLLAALAHKIGEPYIHKPPNPNSKNYQNTGFKLALQSIYDSSTELAVDSKKDSEDEVSTSALSLLNHTSCGIVLLDSNKEILYANTAAPISHDTSDKPFLALDFIDDINITNWLTSLEEKTIRSERRWARVGTDSRLIKKQRFYDIVASYEKGASAETILILIDQSERYLPEEEDLDFIAFAAHELRGPITVIRGYLDTLSSEMADRLRDDEPELLTRLNVSANKLSGYISNILNVVKFDRHHLQVHLHEDSISSIYKLIANDMQLRAQAQYRLLNVNIPDNLPPIAADRSSITEVFSNLIDNAIKYSFEGGAVTVSATVKGDFVEVSVADNGIGIPANVVKNIFRKFYRSHRSRDAVAGSGIGLYLCKALVESHGGFIGVQSRENHGSIFTFSLPIYATVADKLLEDGQMNQNLIRRDGGWINNHSMYRR